MADPDKEIERAETPENVKDETVYDWDDLIGWPAYDYSKLDAERLDATSSLLIAQFLERLEIEQRRIILRLLDDEKSSDVLAEMDEEEAAETLSAMRANRALAILQDVDPDDAADIFAEFETSDQERFLDQMEPESAEDIRDLLTYEPDTAGGIMNPEVDTALADESVDEAITRIRKFTDKHEDLHYVYVVDEDEKLLGTISLRKLIQARPHQKVSEVMNTDIRGVVTVDTDQEVVANLMAEYNLPDLAVVGPEGTLLGVITHDDVIDVLHTEATEDMQLLHGAGGTANIFDDISVGIRNRNPWLQVNLVTAFLAAVVIMAFEEKIGALPLLAAYMPIIASVGGNAGHQALAIAIRSIALNEIRDSDRMKIIRKEAFLGVCNGLLVGLVAAAVAGILTNNIIFSIVVISAMTLNMALAGLAGAFIPLMLERIKLDPAQSSSIFLTGITDIAGFFIFLSLGSWLLL